MEKFLEIFSYVLLGILVVYITYFSFMLNKTIKGKESDK